MFSLEDECFSFNFADFHGGPRKKRNCAEKKKVFNFSTENFLFCRHQKPEKKKPTQVDEYENQLSVIITYISVD
jgi:hypothetical protein